MIKYKTLAIAVAALGLSYGIASAQSTAMTDDEYLALANSEAFGMFADEPAPLAPRDFEKVYILGLGQVQSSFYCALDVMDKVSEMIGTDQNGILFVQVSDIAPYMDSASCFDTDDEVDIVSASYVSS